jgi:hypothetical protein
VSSWSRLVDSWSRPGGLVESTSGLAEPNHGLGEANLGLLESARLTNRIIFGMLLLMLLFSSQEQRNHGEHGRQRSGDSDARPEEEHHPVGDAGGRHLGMDRQLVAHLADFAIE